MINTSAEASFSSSECVALLRTRKVGRIVYDDGGSQVRPVNYIVVDEQILVRMDRAFDDATRVVFEIDYIDDINQQGWSVIVEGRAFSVPLTSIAADGPDPWAPGSKAWSTTIVIDEISGRWVRAANGGGSTDGRPTDGRGYI